MDDVFNIGEQEKIEKQQEDEKAALEQQKRINYQTTFATRNGQAVLKDLMRKCHGMAPTYANTDRDSAFQEGERNVFLYIMGQLTEELQKQILGG